MQDLSFNYNELGCAVTLRAAKDFFRTKKEERKKKIIKDLKSSWMDYISRGNSIILAEKLEHNPDEVYKNLKPILETEEEN